MVTWSQHMAKIFVVSLSGSKIFVVKVTTRWRHMHVGGCLRDSMHFTVYMTHDVCIPTHTHKARRVTGVCVFDRFQSERESGDRNFAIGYYLKEKKVWIRLINFFFYFSVFGWPLLYVELSSGLKVLNNPSLLLCSVSQKEQTWRLYWTCTSK